MKKIYKYNLEFIKPIQVVVMPKGAKILSVQEQKSFCMMWAEVDENETKEDRYFDFYLTGQDMPEFADQYIGTVQMANGDFVMHIYELKNAGAK